MSRNNDFFNKSKSSSSSSLLYIIFSVVFAYIVTILIFMLFAALVTYSDFSENYIPTIVTAATIIGVLLSGILSGRKATSKGWLNGALAGIIYIIALYILGFLILKNAQMTENLLNLLFLGLGVGAFGGIIGINLRRRR